MVGGQEIRGRAVAAVATLAWSLSACGSGAPDQETAKTVALRALMAYDTGDVKTLCALTPAAKLAQFSKGTTCKSFYTALFIQQSGQDAIDQAMRPPFRPGEVTEVRRESERTILTVKPKALRLTPLQRRGLKLRYGAEATALKAPKPFPVTVTKEKGRLVAGF